MLFVEGGYRIGFIFLGKLIFYVQKNNKMKLKTRQEIAQEYGIVRETLYRKLVAVGIELDRGLITVSGQEKIYAVLGKPRSFKNSVHNDFIKEEDPRIAS